MKPFHHQVSSGFLTEEFLKQMTCFILQMSEKVQQLYGIETTAGIQPHSQKFKVLPYYIKELKVKIKFF